MEIPDVDGPLRKILKHQIEVDDGANDDWHQFHFCTIICIEINKKVSFFFFFLTYFTAYLL